MEVAPRSQRRAREGRAARGRRERRGDGAHARLTWEREPRWVSVGLGAKAPDSRQVERSCENHFRARARRGARGEDDDGLGADVDKLAPRRRDEDVRAKR